MTPEEPRESVHGGCHQRSQSVIQQTAGIAGFITSNSRIGEEL
jgi:hypothetical protein